MADLRFTRHARNVLRKERLTPAEIAAVMEAPDAVTPSEHGRSNAWKRTARGWIRVTFIHEGPATLVITVTPRRKGPTEGSSP